MKHLRFTFLGLTMALCAAAQAAETHGSRLDRLLAIKERAELARQERALLAEMGAVSTPLPSIIAITGNGKSNRAKLLLPSGAVRSFGVGEHIAGGWSVGIITVDEVIVTKAGSRDPRSAVSLSFTPRDGAAAEGRSTSSLPASTSVIPPLPAPIRGALPAQQANKLPQQDAPAPLEALAPAAANPPANPSANPPANQGGDFVLPAIPGLTAPVKK